MNEILYFHIQMRQQINFNRFVRILPRTIARDLGTEWACNDPDHSKAVIVVLIITVLEILDSVKWKSNGSAPHTECVIKIKTLRSCSRRFDVNK